MGKSAVVLEIAFMRFLNPMLTIKVSKTLGGTGGGTRLSAKPTIAKACCGDTTKTFDVETTRVFGMPLGM